MLQQPGLGCQGGVIWLGTEPLVSAIGQQTSRLRRITQMHLQALYYVSTGIDIPPEHTIGGLVTVTLDSAGHTFDWGNVMRGFFRVYWAKGNGRPPGAHVAVQYKDYWFYIDETDQETKSAFSLLMELTRLELAGKTSPGPQLTLPVSGR